MQGFRDFHEAKRNLLTWGFATHRASYGNATDNQYKKRPVATNRLLPPLNMGFLGYGLRRMI
jgi:hypothetical protein